MLEAHILNRFDPDQHFKSLLKTGTRVDGRTLTGLRRLTMVRGMLQKTTAGSALVKIGGTKVVAGVTLQVGKPGEETPGKGEIGVEVQLPALSHPRYTSLQAQHEEGKALETFVQSVILRCGVVRREDLCIAEGRHVWRLNVDVHCLSHEGSLPDACALAALASLADVKLPGTVISKDDEVLVAPDHPLRPLQLRRFPVPLTMGLYDGKFLCDLTLAEEERVQSRLTLLVDSNTSQICSIQKAGGPAMSKEQLATALTLCGARLKQVALAQESQGQGQGQGEA